MENLIIYKDESTKVEVDRSFFQVYDKMFTNSFRLSEAQHQLILGYIAEILVDVGMAVPDTLIVCPKTVYVLRRDLNIKIGKPFNIFNYGLKIITEQDDFLKNLNTIGNKLNEYYGDKDFLYEFFDEEFLGVRGYFCKVIDEQVYIILFTYKDSELN